VFDALSTELTLTKVDTLKWMSSCTLLWEMLPRSMDLPLIWKKLQGSWME
jgi:hypothetical protein